MNREETKFCEECKHCERIVKIFGNTHYIQCSQRPRVFDNPVIYCKYKKIKKEKNNVK